jgi:lysophospholipase L1-like esterase
MSVLSRLNTAKDEINSAISALVGTSPSEPKSVVRVQIFGDSVARGYLSGGSGQRAASNPQKLMQDAFDAKYGVGRVFVECRAMDSTHSGMLLGGTDGINPAWPGSVDADLVVINHGVNDVAYSLTDATYEANLRALVADCPAQILLQTPTPVSTVSRTVAPIMRAVATDLGIPLIDVRAYIDGIIGAGDKYALWYTPCAPDGVHCNDAGYESIMTGCVVPAMIAKLDEMLGVTAP